jgi:hypothetical protein
MRLVHLVSVPAMTEWPPQIRDAPHPGRWGQARATQLIDVTPSS